jgi:uncharacterized protein YndB with AHSA1/START domain
VVFQTCPTDVTLAPPERVWEELVHPDRLARWTDTHLVDGPRGRSLTRGDRIVLSANFGLRVVFDVRAVEPPNAFVVDVALPLGIVNHATIQIASVDGGWSRVSFG